MLQPLPAHLVAEPQQEVVVVVVVGAVQRIGLPDQVAVGLDLLRARGEVDVAVGGDVQAHGRGRVADRHLGEVTPGQERRVHQGVQGHRCEADRVAGPAGPIQRRAELPARRQGHARPIGDVAREVAGRIEGDGVPLQVQHLRRGHDAPHPILRRREVLVAEVERRRARRNVHMEGVDVHRIARPLQAPAVGHDHQARELGQGAGRGVVARDPLRIEQRHRTTARDRHRLVHLEDPPDVVPGIHLQRDLAGVGDVARLDDRRRHGRRLRLRFLGVGRAGQRNEGGEGEEQALQGRKSGYRPPGPMPTRIRSHTVQLGFSKARLI